MDLKLYYQKIRELEQGMKAGYAVVISLETPDGGTAGVKTEVPARTAAKMIVDGRARPASSDEEREFQTHKLGAKRAADQREASKRTQITVVPESDYSRALKTGKPPAKQ